MAENIKDGKFVHGNTEAPQSNRVMPLFSLKGKTAIVTGAGAGIGKICWVRETLITIN